jgi:uncharacterized membrane protein
MTGSPTALAIAAGLFVVTHLVLATPRVRSPVAGRIGNRGFRIVYSAIAIALIVWMVLAYGDAPVIDLWTPSVALRHLSLAIMPFACILVVAGASTANPSAIGSDRPDVAAAGPVGILKVTRHPMMWGFALWAIAHLLANGDAASAIFFGSLTFLALVGPLAQDAKKRALLGEAWRDYERQTSYLPFLALALGRTRVGIGEIGYARIAGGLALYALLLALHPWLFGVNPLVV